MVNAIDKVLNFKATEGQAAPSFDGRLLSAIAFFSLKLSLPDQIGEVLPGLLEPMSGLRRQLGKSAKPTRAEKPTSQWGTGQGVSPRAAFYGCNKSSGTRLVQTGARNG